MTIRHHYAANWRRSFMLYAAIAGGVVLIISIFTPRGSDLRSVLVGIAAVLCGPRLVTDWIEHRRS